MSNTKLSEVKGGEVNKQVPPHFGQVCQVRVKQASQGVSKNSGNNCLTLECEIIDPLEVEIGGTTYKGLDETRLVYYLPFTEKMVSKIKEVFEKLQIDLNVSEDDIFNDPGFASKNFGGICFNAVLSSRETFHQKKLPNGTYEQILDGHGKPISRGVEWDNNVGNIMGRIPSV